MEAIELVAGFVIGAALVIWLARIQSRRAVRAAMELSDDELIRKVDSSYLQGSVNCVLFDELARRKALTRRLVMK